MKYYLVILCLLSGFSALAQDFNEKFLDSKSYDYLSLLYDLNLDDTLTAKQIAFSYIKKAKVEKDNFELARGYEQLAYVSPISEALKYIDTTISLTKRSDHIDYPAVGYLFKSYYQFYNEAYEESLRNAILGYQSAKRKDNVEQQIAALNGISAINRLWGDHRKSLETEFLALDLVSQYKNKEDASINLLTTLRGIGSSYVRLKQPDSALFYFKKGITKAISEKDSVWYYDFVSRSGEALYLKGDYNAALDSLNKGHDSRKTSGSSYATYNFYAGNIYYNQGNKQKGIAFFEKADSIYENNKILYPELAQVYNNLVKYYREEGNKEKQLKYLDKLVLVDDLIDAKRNYVRDKTEKDYIIPNLLEEKETLIKGLKKQNIISNTKTLWAIGLLGVSVLILLYFVNRQRIYKKRFQNLIESMNNGDTPQPSVRDTTKQTDISEEIITEILASLDRFESKREYLSQDISLNDLAKSFGTNSTYLSKVINLKKDKNFSNYINDLRIDFTLRELNRNPKFRKYTIKAIANESGFKSAESFSKTFYKKHGIYPSFYLKKLRD